eukprot:449125-Hanusia_phi.AAC.2
MQSPELALALAQVKRVKEKLADAKIRGESDRKLKHDLGLQASKQLQLSPALSDRDGSWFVSLSKCRSSRTRRFSWESRCDVRPTSGRRQGGSRMN